MAFSPLANELADCVPGSHVSTDPVQLMSSAKEGRYRVLYALTTSFRELTTTITAASLNIGTSYNYRVTAQNVAGEAPASATLTVSTSGTPATVIASDSFNRADATSLGSTDSAAGGTAKTWSTSSQIGIVGNKAGRLATPTSTRFAWFDGGVADGYAEAVVTLSDTSDLSIVARYQDSTNYYRCIVSSAGNLQLSKTVAGTTTAITSAVNGIVASGDRVGLRLIGTTLQAVHNGVVQITSTDTSLATGTNYDFSNPASLVPKIDDYKRYDK